MCDFSSIKIGIKTLKVDLASAYAKLPMGECRQCLLKALKVWQYPQLYEGECYSASQVHACNVKLLL